MYNNGKGEQYLLDRVLHNLSPEQRERVRDLVITLELDQEDPFWLIVIAIGQLQVLVTDAPEEWQELFINFQAELRTWTETHLETLETIAKQALVARSLGETSNNLNTSTEKLLFLLNKHSKESTSSERELKILNQTLDKLRKDIDSRSEKSAIDLGRELFRIQENISVEIKNLRLLVVCGSVMFALLSFLFLGFFIRLSALQGVNAEKIEWLLKKGNRNDCLQGIKRKDSLECKNLINNQ